MRYFIAIAIVIVLLFIQELFFRSELYSDELAFNSKSVVNHRVLFFVDSVDYYGYDDITKYYVFTDIGRLKIDALNSKYGFFFGDSDLYRKIENNVGYYCNGIVDQSLFGTWQIVDLNECSQDRDSLVAFYN